MEGYRRPSLVLILGCFQVSLVLPAFIQAASKELARTELVVLDWLPKLAVHHVSGISDGI